VLAAITNASEREIETKRAFIVGLRTVRVRPSA
jgi:hypothetical protein